MNGDNSDCCNEITAGGGMSSNFLTITFLDYIQKTTIREWIPLEIEHGSTAQQIKVQQLLYCGEEFVYDNQIVVAINCSFHFLTSFPQKRIIIDVLSNPGAFLTGRK